MPFLLCLTEQRHINGLHCPRFTFHEYMAVCVKRRFRGTVSEPVRDHTRRNVRVNQQACVCVAH